MELKDGIKTFHARSRQDWRDWLFRYSEREKGLWLIIYKKDSGVPSVYYPEAVDEALCFGWIDSKPNKRDDRSYYQYFSVRNPRSYWSKVNKEKVERLLSEGRMAAPGLEMVRLAKESGTWNALDEVEALVVPGDLAEAFARHPGSAENFDAFPRSVKRGILEWIFQAKRAATRAKRIEETASKAKENIRANQYR